MILQATVGDDPMLFFDVLNFLLAFLMHFESTIIEEYIFLSADTQHETKFMI